MSLHKISFLSLLLICTITLGCSDDDDPSLEVLDGNFFTAAGSKTMTCNINGQNVDFPELFIAGTSTTSSGLHSKGVTGILISGSDTTHIIVTITYPDESAFVLDAEFNEANGIFGDYAIGYYGYNPNTGGGIESYSTESGTASVVITDIDTVEETWSACFEFTGPDDNSGAIQTITSGSFTDVEF